MNPKCVYNHKKNVLLMKKIASLIIEKVVNRYKKKFELSSYFYTCENLRFVFFLRGHTNLKFPSRKENMLAKHSSDTKSTQSCS